MYLMIELFQELVIFQITKSQAFQITMFQYQFS